MDQLIYVSHVAAPNELPGMVADAAACFEGDDATIYLADLQQRVLVPFQRSGAQSRDDFPHVLGSDSTVAGRAFQQMHRLTQTGTARAGDDRIRVWLPLIAGRGRLGVLGVVLPSAALDDETGMRRLQRFTAVVAKLVVTKTMYGDSIVRLRRTSQMSLAAEVQWSLPPPLTFAAHSVTVAGVLEPADEVAGDSLNYAVDATPHASRSSTGWATAS
jgi:hypothetical protein